MWSKFTETRRAGIALAVLLSAALSLPTHAAEIWKVNYAKSKFTSGANTLVLERDNGKATAAVIDAKGKPTGATFLMVSSSKIYLAMDDAGYASFSSNGARPVAYTPWGDMRLVQIGENVHRTDSCGFRCQSGLPDPRMTLAFTTKGVDASGHMSNVVVLNTR
jgi:hypothetical protein